MSAICGICIVMLVDLIHTLCYWSVGNCCFNHSPIWTFWPETRIITKRPIVLDTHSIALFTLQHTQKASQEAALHWQCFSASCFVLTMQAQNKAITSTCPAFRHKWTCNPKRGCVWLYRAALREYVTLIVHVLNCQALRNSYPDLRSIGFLYTHLYLKCKSTGCVVAHYFLFVLT